MARKILLADDSVTAQNMGRKILADAGYEVITVNNGSAALKKITEQRPDVIVLDVYMPGYSGLEVCQRLKEVAETSRIPILLTVGKLEPFKPEEAKRVRADGFIVKPFEASELLSALTKLEDKIVPRAENSKPGRFGRAAAAMDEPRFDKTMQIEEDDGWKNRISFPSKKKKESSEDDAPSQAPPSGDSRPSVTQIPAPVSNSNLDREEKFDLGALAPPGLPKDVTPEEIAALAAAAARVKGKISDDKFPAQEAASIAQIEIEKPKHDAPAIAEPVPTAQSMAGPGPIYVPEQQVESKPPELKAEPVSDEAAAKKHEDEHEDKSEEVATPVSAHASWPTPAPPDEPVTMAVTPVYDSVAAPARWTAVAVALAPEETAVSLEQEMQKAYAASSGADVSQPPMIPPSQEAAASTSPTPAQPEPPAADFAVIAPEVEQNTTTAASAATESANAAISELESIANADSTPAPVPAESSSLTSEAPVSTPEIAITAPEAQAPVAEISAPAEASQIENVEKVEPQAVSKDEDRSSDKTTSDDRLDKDRFAAGQDRKEEDSKKEEVRDEDVRSEEVKLEPAALATVQVSSESVPESSPKAEEVAPTIESVDAAEPIAEPARKEPDLAESTAAAWASWKQVQKSSEGNGSVSSAADDSLNRDTAAMAAAVGAKSPVDELKDLESDPDVASIVDSVLANLRPKIVQEISRKLGKK